MSVTHDLSQPYQNQNKSEDNDDANSPVAAMTQARTSENFKSSDFSQSNQVEDSNSEEETDQDVHTPTFANTDQSMLSSVRVLCIQNLHLTWLVYQPNLQHSLK